jgi:capsular exopolysaccharide synthesis family protein
MLDRNNQNQLPGIRDPREMAAYAPWHGAYGYGPEVEEASDGFKPLVLLHYLVKYRWLIALLFAVGLVSGVVVTWMQTPKYQATSRLEIMVPSAKVFRDLEVISESADYRSFLTAREKLKSRSVAQRVVFELGLANKADFLFPAPQFALSNLFARAFGWSTDEKLENYTPQVRENIAIGHVRAGLSVELINNTSLLAISFRNQIPKYAKSVANQVATSFINQRVDQNDETSGLARQFIEEQVVQVKQRLQTSEQALVDYAKKEGITVTSEEISLIATNIEQINSALSTAIQERLDYSRTVEQVEAGRGASLPEVLESTGIQNLRQQVAELSAEYKQNLALFKPGYPEMQQLQAQIGELKSQIKEAIEVVTGSIRLKQKEAIGKEADLRAKLTELEGEQSVFQDKNIKYTILKREVDSYRSQYESLIAKMNEVGVGSELRQQSAAIVDAAVVPGAPFSPRLSVNLLKALALFMAIAAAIIYILELLNNTFSNPDQIESELKVPVLGIVPRIEESEIADQLANQKSGMSEAYRSLRTSLQFTGTDGSPRSVLITSSQPSEGKSTTAFKLAQDFGALGMQVLLIDADMRKPAQHYFFGTDNTIGLSNLLTNTARKEDWKRLFRRTRYANVTLLTAGTIPPNPADLLSSPKMTMLYQACISRYDIVIIDSPPVMGLSDAPILTRLVEGVLMVVSANQVPRKSTAAALKRVKSVGGQVFGAAFSKFASKKFEYSYNYKYMSEQYIYGDDNRNLNGETSGGRDANSKNPAETMRNRMRRAGGILRGRLDRI